MITAVVEVLIGVYRSEEGVVGEENGYCVSLNEDVIFASYNEGVRRRRSEVPC